MTQTSLSVRYKPGQKTGRTCYTKRAINKGGLVNDDGVLNRAAVLLEHANLCICLGTG